LDAELATGHKPGGARRVPACLPHNVAVRWDLVDYAVGAEENIYEKSRKIGSAFVNAKLGKRSGLKVQFNCGLVSGRLSRQLGVVTVFGIFVNLVLHILLVASLITLIVWFFLLRSGP